MHNEKTAEGCPEHVSGTECGMTPDMIVTTDGHVCAYMRIHVFVFVLYNMQSSIADSLPGKLQQLSPN